MMRNKVIRAFVAVWCVVCLSYVGVRTAVAAFVDSPVATRKDTGAATSAAEQVESTKSVEQTQTTEPVEQVAPSPVSQSEPVAQNTTDDSVASSDQVVWEEQPEAEPQDTDWEEQTADVPSLSEYLSGFTCGSCHRNCSLDNPRCHNGSRLAEAKAEEYYSVYGQ